MNHLLQRRISSRSLYLDSKFINTALDNNLEFVNIKIYSHIYNKVPYTLVNRKTTPVKHNELLDKLEEMGFYLLHNRISLYSESRSMAMVYNNGNGEMFCFTITERGQDPEHLSMSSVEILTDNYNNLHNMNNFINEYRMDKDVEKKSYFYLLDQYLDEVEFNIPKYTADIDKIYNDDFKEIDELIMNTINELRAGIIVLYGEAGTGKSSYIKHLMNHCDGKIYWLSQSVASGLDSASFTSFLQSCKDSIFILEDCELLLQDRDTGGNPVISSILNMADGILGDSLRTKFICTFNTDIKKIDQALLRKGRLIAKYEFAKLKMDKAKKLAESIGVDASLITTDMTITDIFNLNDMSFNTTPIKKVGFM